MACAKETLWFKILVEQIDVARAKMAEHDKLREKWLLDELLGVRGIAVE